MDEVFHHKDVAFIASVLADEFRVTYGDGSQGDKARELMLAAEFNQQIDSSTMDDFTVKIYGIDGPLSGLRSISSDRARDVSWRSR